MNQTKPNKITSESADRRKVDLADLWEDDTDDHNNWLTSKRQDVAIALSGLLSQEEISYADLADRLSWKRSRISRIFSGSENLTIDTISEIINAANYDFDIVIRDRLAARAMQPWESEDINETIASKLDYINGLCVHAEAMINFAEQINRHAFKASRRVDGERFKYLAVDPANDQLHDCILAQFGT